MKRKTILTLITFLFVFTLFKPFNVNASTFKTSLHGDEVGSIGDKIEFTIAIDSDSQATVFESVLKYDSNILEVLSISTDDNWKNENGVSNSNLKFTNNGISGESTVATIRFKIKNSSTKNFTILSFEEIKLTVAASNEGEENIILTHDNLSKEIKLRSDDNTLKNIKINDKLLNGFNSTTYNYTVEVDSDVEKANITSSLNDSTATFIENFGNRSVDLEYGKNEILIKTKSESEKIVTYVINIIRKDDREIDNDLKSIIINGGKVKINFDKSVLSYTLKAYKLDNVEVEVETSDPNATYELDVPKSLIIGENKIKITVTSITGDKKEYNIILLNRDQATDTRLKNLSVKGLSLEFNSDKYDYYIRYDKSYKNGITIYNTTISNDVEVSIIGNSNLKEGSTIKIKVDAVDGSSSSEYKIILEKDKRINFFCLIEIIIGIVLIVIIIIQIKKRKPKVEQKNNKDIEEELYKTKEIKL